ncbi:MAG: hypothetical protein ACTSWY_09675 [Promethearchaeota archaeon]
MNTILLIELEKISEKKTNAEPNFISNFECKRCGLCCRFFSKQVRYIIEPEEENWSKLPGFYKEIIINFNSGNSRKEIFPLYLSRDKKYRNMHKQVFFIPTKLEYIYYLMKDRPDLQDQSHRQIHKLEDILYNGHSGLLSFSKSERAMECLFLTERNGIAECTINKVHPKMCDIYPENKGYVCLNQKERYFTKIYFNFKKSKFKEVIKVLNYIFPYFSENDMEYAWDLIIFLIDFGFFELEEVKFFFISKLEWNADKFKYVIKNLTRYGLVLNSIRKKKHMIESISSTSIRNKIKLVLSVR